MEEESFFSESDDLIEGQNFGEKASNINLTPDYEAVSLNHMFHIFSNTDFFTYKFFKNGSFLLSASKPDPVTNLQTVNFFEQEQNFLHHRFFIRVVCKNIILQMLEEFDGLTIFCSCERNQRREHGSN